MGEGFDVGKQILAQVGDDALADTLQDDRLQVGAGHGKDQHTCIDCHTDVELRQGEIPGYQLLQRADDQRRNNVVGNGKEHQKQDNDKLCAVGLGITGQTAQNLAVRHRALKAHRLLFVLDQRVGQHQQCRHGADDGADQHQRIEFSHLCHLPLHPPAFAGPPCGGTQRSCGRVYRGGRQPLPCRPQ